MRQLGQIRLIINDQLLQKKYYKTARYIFCMTIYQYNTAAPSDGFWSQTEAVERRTYGAIDYANLEVLPKIWILEYNVVVIEFYQKLWLGVVRRR